MLSNVGLMFATSEIIRQKCFHLPLFTLTFFRTSQKPPQVSVKLFSELRDFFSKSLVSEAILQNAHKNRVMET